MQTFNVVHTYIIGETQCPGIMQFNLLAPPLQSVAVTHFAWLCFPRQQGFPSGCWGVRWQWTGSSHTSSGCGWCTSHCIYWRNYWLLTEGTQCAPLRSTGCTSGRGCSPLGKSGWRWRDAQRSCMWNSPRRVLVCSLKWIRNTNVVNHFIKHFSSENKKQETNYREFSPTHAVTYVALSKNKMNNMDVNVVVWLVPPPAKKTGFVIVFARLNIAHTRILVTGHWSRPGYRVVSA